MIVSSCAGLAKEFSRQTAIASTFSASSASTCALGIGRVERALDMALGVDALVHHAAQIALDQRRRLLPGHVVEARHAQRADFQHVAEAVGGDQADAGALVLEDGVGGDRRAVAELLDAVPARCRSRARPRARPSTMAWA